MWSASVKKFWLHFFEVYKANPCLWDVDSVEYSDKVKRKQAYDELIRLARKVNANADHDFIRARINNVRTAYRKEVRKVLIARQNGTVYKPKLFYFDLINSFLNHDNNLNLDLSYKEEDYSYSDDEGEADSFGGTLEAPIDNNDDSQNTENGRVSADDSKLDVEEITDDIFQNELESQHKATEYIQVSNNVKNRGLKQETIYNDNIAIGTIGIQQQPNVQGSDIIYHRVNKRSMRRHRTSLKEHNDLVNDIDIKDVVKSEHPEKRARYDDEDECDQLGKRLATHFRNMKPQQRLLAEKIISDVCIYARMDQLNLRSSLMIDPPTIYTNFGQNRVIDQGYAEVTEEGVVLAPDAYIEPL